MVVLVYDHPDRILTLDHGCKSNKQNETNKNFIDSHPCLEFTEYMFSVLFVDLEGEVTSTAPYDSSLNDTNSEMYKTYSGAVKESVSSIYNV